MDFIYRQYLPINMEVIFIDLYQLPSNLTSDRAKQYDFVHFTFNTLKTPAEVIRSIFNYNGDDYYVMKMIYLS